MAIEIVDLPIGSGDVPEQTASLREEKGVYCNLWLWLSLKLHGLIYFPSHPNLSMPNGQRPASGLPFTSLFLTKQSRK
jgi:hypothetical protein